MSGPIADDPIRICRSCGAIYLEDPVMDEDPDICPACGMSLDENGLQESPGQDFEFAGL